jgi:hypothetical protein
LQAASGEKRRLLQNAVLNSAISTIEENERQIWLEKTIAFRRVKPLHRPAEQSTAASLKNKIPEL